MAQTKHIHIEKGYTMKVRIYPNKKVQAIIDQFYYGLEKAANMTIYELKQHNPYICGRKVVVESKDKDGNIQYNKDGTVKTKEIAISFHELENGNFVLSEDDTIWPIFNKMSDAYWLNHLRGQSPAVAKLPGGALSNIKDGLFVDVKKAWEKQGKLPVDAWFNKKDKKGRSAVHYYGGGKRINSYFTQISANKFELSEDGKIFVTLPKIGEKIRIRGWYKNITFGKDNLSFFEYYKNSSELLSCRIVKNNIGEYYLTIKLKQVNRKIKESENKQPIGIDVNIKESGVASSYEDGNTTGRFHPNKRFHQQIEERENELNKKLSRRYGYRNEEFRKELSKVKKKNKGLSPESKNPLPKPSNRYKKADLAQKKLALKAARQRDYYQHQISAEEVSNASLIGIEDLSIQNMMKNRNLSSSLSDAAMGSQLEKLKYKSKWAGIPIYEVGKFFPSSQLCPKCGYRAQGEEYHTLDVEEWTCPDCGTVWNRDYAASVNIRNEALEMQAHPEKYIDEEDEKKSKTKNKKIPKDKPLDKNNTDIIMHYDPSMREKHKNPWVVIKESTGEILDDAQGYGYDTAQKAQRAYRYKYLKKAV